MRVPLPQPWGLCLLPLLLLLPPQTPRAGEGRARGRAGRAGPLLGKEPTKHDPNFPGAGASPCAASLSLITTSPSSLAGASGKHLSPCLRVPVPLSPWLPPLSGSAPFSGVQSSPRVSCPSYSQSLSPHFCVPPTDSYRSLLYHFTCVSAPAPGTPAFWVSGWLGPQQYLSYNNLRAQAEPCGAWIWETQVSWYWEKETTDLRYKQKLFLIALSVLEKRGEAPTPGPEGGGALGVRGCGRGPAHLCGGPQVPTPCRACWAVSWALTTSRCQWPSLP